MLNLPSPRPGAPRLELANAPDKSGYYPAARVVTGADELNRWCWCRPRVAGVCSKAFGYAVDFAPCRR